MTPLGGLILVLCIFLGIGFGYCISKRIPNFIFKHIPTALSKKDKKIEEVLKNPHLLVEKLKASGKIYDEGKELDIKVGKDHETGQEVVVIEEIKKPKKGKPQLKASKSFKKKSTKKLSRTKQNYNEKISVASKKKVVKK